MPLHHPFYSSINLESEGADYGSGLRSRVHLGYCLRDSYGCSIFQVYGYLILSGSLLGMRGVGLHSFSLYAIIGADGCNEHSQTNQVYLDL